jgi:glycosyltransferase involved in cell wall biosynthesis
MNKQVRFFCSTLLIGVSFFQTSFCSLEKKIVALMPVRNEARTIEQILRAIACYSDSMVILDDASDDNTLEILHNLAGELTIEKIIEKKTWVRDEKADRQALLDAGRAVGGTHFIVLDADQMFSADCLRNGWLRNRILCLEPGQVLCAPILNIWGSIDKYRDDPECNPYQKRWMEPVVVCDDGFSNYSDVAEMFGASGAIHIWRFPLSLKGLMYQNITDLDHGVLHFKSINLEDVFFKCIWYMFLELVYLNKKEGPNVNLITNSNYINDFYYTRYDGGASAHDPNKARCSKVKPSWYAYPFFRVDDFMKPDILRKADIKQWIKEYGISYFAYLDVWDKTYFKKFIHEIGMSEELLHINTLRQKNISSPVGKPIQPVKKKRVYPRRIRK